MSTNNTISIDDLRKLIHEKFIEIEGEVIEMAADILASLIALDTRVNDALGVIEEQQAGGLTSDEVATLTTANTATAVRAETDAGTTPPTTTARRFVPPKR